MRNWFKYLIGVVAVGISATSCYFSVWGLSQLFAGASTAVIIMAGILEIAKVVGTTALHRYWTNLAMGLKVYLILGITILMLITSAGIYGFLSNAYQKTANRLEIHEGELRVQEDKKKSFELLITKNDRNIEQKTKRLDNLSNLRSQQETRLDASSKRDKVSARRDINTATLEIQKLSTQIDELTTKNTSLNDSVSKYSSIILDIESKSSVAAEVGPLKYIAQLTGVAMDRVVNYLILLLIFVFDPLAIILILVTNSVFSIEENPKITRKNTHTTQTHNDTSVFDAEDDLYEEYEQSEDSQTQDEQQEVITEPESEVLEETIDEEVKPDKHPVVPTGKIELDDIRERRENTNNRGYSVPVPNSRTNNTIERIGSNKFVKGGDSNKLWFQRNKPS